MTNYPAFYNLYFHKSYGNDNEYEQYLLRNRDNKKESLSKIFADGMSFQGAIALLKSEKYPKYSQMFYVYRKDDGNTINIEFTKCFTEDDREIFVKNEDGKFNDCIFCSFNVKKTIFDECTWGTITFFKNSGV